MPDRTGGPKHGWILEPADTSFHHVAHPEITRDPRHINGLTLVYETRISRDDEQPGHARQRGNDVIDHSVGKVFLLRIAAHIGERQDRDRRLVWQRKSWSRWFGCRLGRGLLRVRNAAVIDRHQSRGTGASWLFPNLRYETEPPAQHSANQALLMAVVADRVTRRIHPCAQGGFRDSAPLPDGRQHIVPADHALAIADEVFQKIEHLWLDRDRRAGAAKLAPVAV